jgi:hypothetical protein
MDGCVDNDASDAELLDWAATGTATTIIRQTRKSAFMR